MIARLWHRLTFSIERQLVRGAQYRLLVVAALVGLISILGGAAVMYWGTDHERFADAVWWAFLRLSDPGYLGDDVGAVNRIVSTLLTVLGYVVFLGALVAVMTQWLNARMARLESGLTPIARNDHILVLGWTNRTPAIVRELLLSKGRVRRFLEREGARSLHVVLLVERVTAALVQDLRDAVGDVWDERTVTVRSGSAIRLDHLGRVDFRHASRIVLPGAELGAGGADAVDTNTVKTLLSLSSEEDGSEELPLVVAEIFNVSKIPVARRAYRGELEVVASDAVISRLLAQTVRHPGLSSVFSELLTHGAGSEIYIRTAPEALVGLSIEEAAARYARAVLLGVVRREGDVIRPYLNPPPGFGIEAGDSLALLADDYDDAAPDRSRTEEPVQRAATSLPPPGAGGRKRVLLLGWNHKVPQLVREFATYAGETFEVDVLSTLAIRARERALQGIAVSERVQVRHVEADFTVESELRAAEPASYDAVILVGSDRQRSEEESDARTLLGYLSLQAILGQETRGRETAPKGSRVHTVVELLEPNNVPLLGRTESDVLVSPLVASHMLALVALRRELRAVFDELFTAGGAEISFRSPSEYGLSAPTMTFGEVRRAADAHGEIALGMWDGRGSDGLLLNPARDASWEVGEALRVVALVTYAGES